MRYKPLGRTGLFVSELCLGTMTFGGSGAIWSKIGDLGQSEAERLIGQAIEAGINFIDTADVYSAGMSEQITGQALRNLEKYTQNEAFNNPNGGNSPFGPYIQFDTKGVEFGPWIRRFVAQIKRNWLIPEAAMVMKGHVVVTFNVHKDGRITDIAIKQPSGIDAFDRAAANSLQWSNPTTPLPPEYPSPVAQFTVTFYYNEQPPSQ